MDFLLDAAACLLALIVFVHALAATDPKVDERDDADEDAAADTTTRD